MILIINKSDSTGGAAVVCRRLLHALRAEGADARMLVAERLTDDPDIALIAPAWRRKAAFLADRLPVALANGARRDTLFKIDAASAGIDITRHPWVREADVILINWINQGVLSLHDISRLLSAGKRIIWTMHDMWNFTGVCHHAGECQGYELNEPGGGRCGFCPLLGRHAGRHDLSLRVNDRKHALYSRGRIDFVAVSSWLARKAAESRLLHDRHVHVIPNAFPIPDPALLDCRISPEAPELHLIFGAARLDDPIKDFPMLIEVLRQLRQRHPDLAARTRLALYGAIKDTGLLSQIPISVDYHGLIRNPETIRDLYLRSHIVLSTSRWETLPGTLIEGQAYGCWPIAFDAGGQSDIIDTADPSDVIDRSAQSDIIDSPAQSSSIEATGTLLPRRDAVDMADAIAAAASLLASDPAISGRLHAAVARKFSAPAIARAYLSLIQNA